MMATTTPVQGVGRGVRLKYPSRTYTTGELSEFLSAVGAAWDACLYLTQVARLRYRHAPIVWDLRDHRPDDAAPTLVEPEAALAMRQMRLREAGGDGEEAERWAWTAVDSGEPGVLVELVRLRHAAGRYDDVRRLTAAFGPVEQARMRSPTELPRLHAPLQAARIQLSSALDVTFTGAETAGKDAVDFSLHLLAKTLEHPTAISVWLVPLAASWSSDVAMRARDQTDGLIAEAHLNRACLELEGAAARLRFTPITVTVTGVEAPPDGLSMCVVDGK
jgi:hypothetical protein